MKKYMTKSKISEIGTLISNGIDMWIQAGTILCSYLDDGGTIEGAADECGINAGVLLRFEQIGRKQILPELLAETSPGGRALSLCSYSEQKRHIKEPIGVMTGGGTDSMLVGIDNLTPYQIRQTFCRGHIRTLPEQRSWIESEKAKNIQPESVDLPYSIVGKKITFRSGVTISLAEMKKLIKAMS